MRELPNTIKYSDFFRLARDYQSRIAHLDAMIAATSGFIAAQSREMFLDGITIEIPHKWVATVAVEERARLMKEWEKFEEKLSRINGIIEEQ